MPDVKRRMQLNVGFERKVLSKKLKELNDDDQIIFPTVWFEQSVKPKTFFQKQVLIVRRQFLICFSDDNQQEPDHLHTQPFYNIIYYLSHRTTFFCSSYDQKLFRKSRAW
jgi:hypothetical protein